MLIILKYKFWHFLNLAGDDTKAACRQALRAGKNDTLLKRKVERGPLYFWPLGRFARAVDS